jgi:hypothetical protein
MVKPTKYFRKQADKADRVANRSIDPEITAELHALAVAALKRKEKAKRPLMRVFIA